MPLFEYTARNAATGQIQKGQLDVPDQGRCRRAPPRKNRMIVVNVREAAEADQAQPFGSRASRPATS